MKRPLLIALAIAVPLALFIVARQAALRRPILVGTQPGARTLQLSRGGARLFSHGPTETLVWNTQTRARSGGWPLPSYMEVPSPDGTRMARAETVVVTSDGQTAATWMHGEIRETRKGAKIREFGDVTRHSIQVQEALHDLKWSDDGREIVTLTNSALSRFDARTRRLVARVPYAARNGFTSWKLAPDYGQIVATDRRGTTFFDATTGKQRRFWKHPMPATRAAPIVVLEIAPGGQWLLGSQRRGRTKVLLFQNARDGAIVWQKLEFGSGGAFFKFCGFSRDGQRVLAMENGRILALASGSGRELWHFKASQTQDAALSPDGRFVYTLDIAGALWRWNVPT